MRTRLTPLIIGSICLASLVLCRTSLSAPTASANSAASPASAILSSALSDNGSQVYPVDNRSVLVRVDNRIDAAKDRLVLVDLQDGTLIKDLSSNQDILDVHTLSHPNKLIVISRSSSGKIIKLVYNDQGTQLRSFQYPISVDSSAEAKWAAPYGKVNERLMIRTGSKFSLYEPASKSALAIWNASLDDNSGYEFLQIDDWDFAAYPYLAIKYYLQGIMSDSYEVQTVNLYSRSAAVLNRPSYNTRLQIVDRNKLELWSSYTYSDTPSGNSPVPKPAERQAFHSLYLLNSGQFLRQDTHLFNQTPGRTSGWKTQLSGAYVCVQDLGTGGWSLYNRTSGVPIALNQSGLPSPWLFLSYDPDARAAYFLFSSQESSNPPSVKKVLLP
ncbi:hypothetical protein [Paenibacillus glufosinatiresistens]|uniref:hypothetical protein n=1 Tax=Paenibacillus glufosinatiresistens TaxID=3070657 RepID=UPI00286E8B98|nr:hypothetical protein [Paenibacillus sp. YX.27]